MITEEELIVGIMKSYENASNMYDDANILFQNNRLERAYSLFQLCTEEVGKVIILYQAVIATCAGIKVDPKFLKGLGFREHMDKTVYSIDLEIETVYMFVKSQGDPKGTFKKYAKYLLKSVDEVEKLNNLKNHSLYVSVIEDRFVSPSEKINKGLVEDIEFQAKIRLGMVKQFYVDKVETIGESLRLLEEKGDAAKKNQEYEEYIESVKKWIKED